MPEPKTTMHKPTHGQLLVMGDDYAIALDALLPDGADKTHMLRKLREIAMWANVVITRLPDGMPRE